MFNFFKKKQNNTYMLGAVAKGKAVELKRSKRPDIQFRNARPGSCNRAV